MRNDIQPYQDQPLDVYSDSPETSEQAESGASLLRYLDILRRRWLTVVLVWPLALVPAVAGVWLLAKVTYTATTQIEVRPNPGFILYPSDDRYVGSLDGMLNTQAHLMTSQGVLNAALANLKLKNPALDLFDVADSLAAIRQVVSAHPIRGSHIVQLEVERPDEESGKAIAQAVLDAYLSISEAAEQQKDENTLREVKALREKLSADVQNKRGQITARALLHNANSPQVLALLQQSKQQYSETIRQELDAAKAVVVRLEQDLKKAREGVMPENAQEDTLAALSQAIENDPMVRSLQQQLVAKTEELARLRQVGLTEAAKQIVEARSAIDELKAELAKERIRAAEEIEKTREAMSRRMVGLLVGRLENQLDRARGVEAGLQRIVTEIQKEIDDLGRASVELQNLQRELETLEKEFEVANQRVQELETERRRPSRILVASEPEVRPDGVKDKRVKLSLAAVFGTLFFALAAAFLKDYLDPRVHAPQQVESGLGLRLLGLVPSLKDLKEGRITEGEFAESYRLVRACLSVAAPNGSQPKSFLTTSAQACEGKTSLAISLAASLAEAGNRVLLIDGDIQGPQVERVLKLKAVYTLKDVLAGDVSLAQAVVNSNLQHLEVLAARLDSGSARGVLNTRTAVRLIKQAMEQYDYVVVDSPPTLGAADAVVWAEAVDGVILSSFAGQSNSHAIKMACQRLRSVGARILGAVMCNLSIREGYYSFSTSGMSARSAHPDASRNGSRSAPHVQLPVVEIHPSESESETV
ncbi:MAG: polysaccharide biosynthesis tyrosine autokinase [Phycisphaerae bacterium]|nr:polysaccharide biosynthesis tyrosine autokinase [Phycisphaerae bacterium]